MTVHNFRDSLAKGKTVEYQLDDIFSKWYEIQQVSLQTEITFGYDRIYTRKIGDKEPIKVEYKADWWTERTGNLFIEYAVNEKPGWAVKTQADIILYASLRGDLIYNVFIIPREYIKVNLESWKQQYEHRIIENTHFVGAGILLPRTSLDFSQVKEMRFTYGQTTD